MKHRDHSTMDAKDKKKFGCLQVAAVVFATIVVTAGATYWIVRSYLFPSPFKPVALSAQAEKALQKKIAILAGGPVNSKQIESSSSEALKNEITRPLKPEAYSEEGASRLVRFTEKELNALLAKNTDLATKVAIDLSDNLVSARLRIPVDPDFPFLGGRIIRAKAGLELAYHSGRPVVVIKGVSVMGVPVPSAWLGGLKNVDLVKEFGGSAGFWKTFSEGVEFIKVEDGYLTIKLKE